MNILKMLKKIKMFKKIYKNFNRNIGYYRQFRSRHVPGHAFADVLVEYQWRRWCKKNNLKNFHELIDAILGEYSR